MGIIIENGDEQKDTLYLGIDPSTAEKSDFQTEWGKLLEQKFPDMKKIMEEKKVYSSGQIRKKINEEVIEMILNDIESFLNDNAEKSWEAYLKSKDLKKEEWESLIDKDSSFFFKKMGLQSTQSESNKLQTYDKWLAEQKEKKALSKEERAKEILKKTRFIQVSLGEWEKMKKTLEETKKRFAVSQEENERLKKAKCALLVTDGTHLPTIFSSITEEVVKKVVDVNDELRDHIQNLEIQNSNLAKAYESMEERIRREWKECWQARMENHNLKNKMKMYIGFSILGGGIFLYNIAKILFGS